MPRCCFVAALLVAVVVARRESYRAASVMHSPLGLVKGNTVAGIIEQNLAAYDGFVATAAKDGTDIIVFPEAGTGFLFVPHPDIRLMCEPVPPTNWTIRDEMGLNCSEVLAQTHHVFDGRFGLHAFWASCTAAKHNIHIVINYCENATTHFYNDNVAFAPDGRLLARYRKSHITGTGPYLDQPTVPDPVTFDTTFGVRFGTFTCYDFWFQEPMVDEMRRLNVRDFANPLMMTSAAPYYRMPDVQNGWSFVNNVTLISSVAFGTGGGGVFHRGQPLVVNSPIPDGIMDAQRMVIADVPIVQRINDTVRPRVVDERVRSKAMAMSRAHHQAQHAVSAHLAKSKCVYGPFVPGNALNFSVGCDAFHPFTNGTGDSFRGHDRVRKFELHAEHRDAMNLTHVSCRATVVVPLGQTADANTSTTWILAAFAMVQAPSVETPSSLYNGACLVIMCNNTEKGCMTMQPSDNFETNLKVRSIHVAGTLRHGFNATNTMLYPFVGAAKGTLNASYTDYPVPAAEWKSYSFGPTKDGLLRAEVGSDAHTATALRDHYFHSAGFWATAFYKTLQ